MAAGICFVASLGAVVVAAWRGPWWLVLAATAAVAARLLRPDPDPERWQRGADGEKRTAMLLTRLPRRFVVLHDLGLPGGRANIDHLVVGPTGVWVVDSKAYRAGLEIRRGAVWAGQHRLDTAPAAWEAERLACLLGTLVQPIVAVHAAGLRRRGKVVDGVRVLPAVRLCRRIRRGGRVLSRAEIADIRERILQRLSMTW